MSFLLNEAVSASPPARVFASARDRFDTGALDQLRAVAARPGVRQTVGFPDLHRGQYGPVGCAVLADRLHPLLIGNDIGCGMALFVLDIGVRRLRLDKAAARLRALEGVWDGPAADWLARAGLPADLAPDALGTVGGGNHFCELQALVGDAAPPEIAAEADRAFLLIHSGSRRVGTAAFDPVQTAVDGLTAGSRDTHAYRAAHDEAVRWAALNRFVIALRAASALRADLRLVADAPHNLVEETARGFLHRKGAAKADIPLVPLAGSRDAPSYLLRPTGAVPEALASLSHGAGRKHDRAAMHARIKGDRETRARLARNAQGGAVVCDDKALLIEEAPSAYKPVKGVRDDLVAEGLADCVAEFKPLVTFKKAGAEGGQTVLRKMTGRTRRRDKRRDAR